MKQIKLKKMEIANFKGIEKMAIDFGERTDIQGGNATGKSSIYEAYLWALFGKNSNGNVMNVQPLDEHNEYKHNLQTSVCLTLDIDGQEIKVAHYQDEKWTKQRGSAELKYSGVENSYRVNDVPMTKGEYETKLGELCELGDWLMLSSLNILPNMQQDERRKQLTKIAPDFNEEALMADYPEVLKAYKEGKNANDLMATTKSTRKQAQERLDKIPAMIDAQEKLRKVEDWEALEKEKEEVTKSVDDIDSEIRQLSAPTIGDEELRRLEEKREELQKVTNFIALREAEHRKSVLAKKQEAELEVERIRLEIQLKQNEQSETNRMIDNANKGISDCSKSLNNLRDVWTKKNQEEYTPVDVQSICPTCGQQLPDEMVTEAKRKAEEKWNTEKVESLKATEAAAASVKTTMATYKESLYKYEVRLQSISSKIEELQKQMDEIKSSAAIDDEAAITSLCSADKELQDAYAKKQSITTEVNSAPKSDDDTSRETKINSLREERKRMSDTLSELKIKLQGREDNKRIDDEQKLLTDEQKQMAQVVADCEKVEAEVAAYKKRRIEMVEQYVSSYFTMIHWKLYEQNVSNDGEKEICQAIINGIPYDQQNRATQFNAALDMINGFSKAKGILLPIFIDNKESVTDLIHTDAQVITMTVVSGAKLSILQK